MIVSMANRILSSSVGSYFSSSKKNKKCLLVCSCSFKNKDVNTKFIQKKLHGPLKNKQCYTYEIVSQMAFLIFVCQQSVYNFL